MDAHTGIIDLKSGKRPVTLQLEESLVEQILHVKALTQKQGQYFSISDICQQALRHAVVEIERKLGVYEKDEEVFWI